jgi:rubrerythrin
MSASSNLARTTAHTPPTASRDAAAGRSAPARDDAVICERCGAEMFRMHAVWRCPACRYKTDCCGW